MAPRLTTSIDYVGWPQKWREVTDRDRPWSTQPGILTETFHLCSPSFPQLQDEVLCRVGSPSSQNCEFVSPCKCANQNIRILDWIYNPCLSERKFLWHTQTARTEWSRNTCSLDPSILFCPVIINALHSYHLSRTSLPCLSLLCCPYSQGCPCMVMAFWHLTVATLASYNQYVLLPPLPFNPWKQRWALSQRPA